MIGPRLEGFAERDFVLHFGPKESRSQFPIKGLNAIRKDYTSLSTGIVAVVMGF